MNIKLRASKVQILKLLVLGLAGLLGAFAHAQGIIQSVSGSLQGGREVVKIDFSEAPSVVPAGFVVQSPARIALDFPGVSSAVGRSTVDVSQGNLKSISVVQAGDRARVVLNLKQPSPYKAEISGKSIFVSLDDGDSGGATASNVFAEANSKAMLPLKDIDFRRGADGVGRVIVSMASSQVAVDMRSQGRGLMVEFMKSSLPEGLRRKMDVADFGTPVRFITSTQFGDRVRMVIDAQGAWEHSAYQSEDQFVVEVKEIKTDPKKLTPGTGYSGQKLSLNFQSIEIRSLLQVIADFTNFNIVTSDSVTGSVTLRLQEVPWDQALDIILQAKGLGMRKSGNVLWVAPKDEIAAREKLELETVLAVQNLEPLRTQSFQINYAKAADIAAGLIGSGAGGGAGQGATPSRILSSRGSVIFETRTNQLFVTDISSKLEQVQQLIGKIDIAVRQVLIEARIVEAADSFGKSLGVKLGGGGKAAADGDRPGVSVGSSFVAGSAATSSGNFVNLPSTGALGNASPGQFAVSIFGAGADRFLNLEISALESEGKGKVVSSPRVVTADQNKALIEQGTELPYQVASSSGATSIAFRKANLKLEVVPQITPEGDIILTLDVTKDTVGQSTPAGFAIDTKHVQTQVLVENGGTVVIGGIFTESSNDTETKVPFFGDLPGLGVLFRGRAKETAKREMLVFITPKVVADKTVGR
ncbi:MAG: type IV pilus secretin PilQ [Rhodoferax sp.]|nr:type IV pilus secretin PilQ [Rhodoferax sp.]